MPRMLLLVGLLIATPPRLPAQPALTTPAHLGATRGKRTDLTLTGTKLVGVADLRTSFPATVTIPPGQTDAAKLIVTLDIPADAPIGPHTIRIGPVTPARPFAVDELPEVAATGSNRSRAKAQPIPVPCVVVGTVAADAGDCYRLPVTAGRPVTLDVLAKRLGSDLDPVLLVADGNGRELAGLATDDTPGLKGDARVVVVPKADGELVVEVRDTLYRGGPAFGYRLRVGDFPAVTTAFPSAVQRGVETKVEFVGADGVAWATLTAPDDPAVTVAYATPRRADGLAGWPVPVRVSDFPEVVEAGPTTRVPVPGGASARFSAKGEKDVFVFAGRKGKKLAVRAEGAEVRLRVFGPDGREVGKSDPTKPEAVVEFGPAADGDYRAECGSLNYAAGPDVVYHLTIGPAPPAEEKKK
jgi:hypothetical protein